MEAEAKHTNIEGLPARAEYETLALQGDQHLMQSPGRYKQIRKGTGTDNARSMCI